MNAIKDQPDTTKHNREWWLEYSSEGHISLMCSTDNSMKSWYVLSITPGGEIVMADGIVEDGLEPPLDLDDVGEVMVYSAHELRENGEWDY